MRPKEQNRLTLFICLAIGIAIPFALLFPKAAQGVQPGGEIFLRLLKMIVIPLVVSSVMSGILGLGDVRRLGMPGLRAVAYFLTTTLFAVTIGLIVVNIIQPGVGSVDPAQLEAIQSQGSELAKRGQEDPSIGTILHNLMLMLFTDNLIKAAAEDHLLPLIGFSVIFAGMLTTMGQQVFALNRMIHQINDALMQFVLLLMKVAPIGIFCLVAGRFGEAQAEGEFFQLMSQTGSYVLTVVIGLFFHGAVTLPLVLWLVTKRNPYRFIMHMSEALLTAFSTASSSATLPVTMECARVKAGLSEESTKFVPPLGATLNMDGTALYEAVAAIFIAQAIGIELTFLEQIVVALTAVLASIGAAGIPEAGLVTMVIVLNAVGLPVEYLGLILSVDWLLDRFRTAVNVLGDSVGAAVVEPSLPRAAPQPPA